MAEMVLNAKTLPEPLSSMIQTKRVKVQKSNGIIKLIPILESSEDDCPLLGLAVDSNLTVDKFLAMTNKDKELER